MPNVTTPGRGNGGRCFHPGDDGLPTAALLQHGASPCFHPGGERPVAAADPAVRPVSPCHHPDDDLAVDLHLPLTGAEERDLAALAGRPA